MVDVSNHVTITLNINSVNTQNVKIFRVEKKQDPITCYLQQTLFKYKDKHIENKRMENIYTIQTLSVRKQVLLH